MPGKALEPIPEAAPHSESDTGSPSTGLPPLHPLPRALDGPVASPMFAPPAPPSVNPSPLELVAGIGGTSIPLCHPQSTHPVFTSTTHSTIPTTTASAIRTLLTCIDICLVMITMHISTLDASTTQYGHRKKSRRSIDEGASTSHSGQSRRLGPGHDTLGHTHAKQLIDIVAWHVGVLDAKWYVKPISTCWFEEYLFNIYTPEMFYDILRMRRRTFDRLVCDLRPYIQGQHTHWREPIGVEKRLL